jgi:RHS repeat-associated protein
MAGISSKAAFKLENKLKYNGKEEQRQEFSDGSGLEWMDYGARLYDAQIGRWNHVDPESEIYNSISPFVYVANNPLLFIDPDGRKLKVANTAETAADNVAKIAATSFGAQVLNQLIGRSETYSLKSVWSSFSSEYNANNRTISYVGNPWKETAEGGVHNSMTASGHEIMHAYDHSYSFLSPDEFSNMPEQTEPHAESFANYLRDAYSLSPFREKYGSIKGDFHQFKNKYGKEKISDFTSLGANEDNTSFGYSFTKTTTIRERCPLSKVKSRTVQQQFIMVSLDSEKNISFQIFDNEDDYKKATNGQ